MKPVTLITGGSRGIGAACVRIFAAQERRVWFTYCQSEAAAQQLAAHTGAVPIRSDVSDPACNAALAEQMTGYPAEQDAFHLESLEEQKKVWFSGIGKETFVALQNGFAGSGQSVELALELDRP